MKCPVCKETHLVISEKKGIEIDYCPDCRGIWLDRGELDKIIEKSKAAEEAPALERAQPTYPSPQVPHQQPHPTYYKKRKSFLEELFD